MRDKTPFSWIENAEAKRVLNAARFEGDGTYLRHRAGPVLRWRHRLSSWLADASRPLWPEWQLQPALARARRPDERAGSARREASYSCEW